MTPTPDRGAPTGSEPGARTGPMTAGAARAAAVDWVTRHAAPEPGFLGAYFGGSTVALPDDAPVPAGSDVDVFLVVEEPGAKVGKFEYHGALLEISPLPAAGLATPEQVLGRYHLAGPFRTDTVIADPTGHLRALHRRVAVEFAREDWVRRRCADVAVAESLRRQDPAAPWHARVTGWLFPTACTAHVLLVAALRNPTVRLRHLAVRGVLADYGLSDGYPELLELLGCATMTAATARRHLDALADTFDAAAAVARTRFPFSSDITPAARPIAIDASRTLIDRGLHRETVFWTAATFARCHAILAADAPELGERLAPAFGELTADLGVATGADLARRTAEVLAYLPRLAETADAIIAAHPEITRP
ncbi:hypothetical protein Lfu02_64830 [Longispora fulva]|uniref:Polymerase nucleotidyl transferase domain-containing protein n=1 Tax=Longispora fulva TaxID=619741 RepID=A0A8J7GC04_9ACTN|nr:hypothetical protein [Longispora fulva]MBG6137733.1 hypothetical protein [Longispora fulva]GIG62111.1 hypothetical protein Lfu02_64830 [Longispora fulva]